MDKSDKNILIASHYGVIKFGDLECEVVVLEDGTRGYVRRELAKMLGFHGTHKVGRFANLLADFAPNSLISENKKGWPFLLPSGQKTDLFPAGIIPGVVAGVVEASINGKLHLGRQHIVPNCIKILTTLATVGEVALIDEATGYQYHRAPDALQDLIGKLLRESCASWERRFFDDYYSALYRLFGKRFSGMAGGCMHVIAQITDRWVYAPILLPQILQELKTRKALTQKRHQWLRNIGLERLKQQIYAVTAIARQSYDYQDFSRRCDAAFSGTGIQFDCFGEGEE